MADKPLSGRTILVLEDEFFQARGMKTVLEEAGATVAGPVGRDEDAAALLGTVQVDAAILDINLGGGPSFETARALQQAGVPFAFVTGYDAATVPSSFASVPRFAKPANERVLIQELSHFF